MSVSKWRYTEECNGRPCPGDCDHCSFEPADLISRADAIEAVTKLCVDGYKAKVDGYFIPLTDALINTLSALPSADAVQGEWIFNCYEKTNKSWFECSVCGSDYFHKHNFCPNCGAIMKGGDTE